MRAWIRGDDPGVGIFEVDPPLAPDEVEVDLSDLVDADAGAMSSAELAALEDLTRGDAREVVLPGAAVPRRGGR